MDTKDLKHKIQLNKKHTSDDFTNLVMDKVYAIEEARNLKKVSLRKNKFITAVSFIVIVLCLFVKIPPFEIYNYTLTSPVIFPIIGVAFLFFQFHQFYHIVNLNNQNSFS